MPSPRIIRPIFSAAGFLLLVSCSLFAPKERVHVEKLSNRIFPAKARAADVAIHFGEYSSPFTSIARIEAFGLPGGSIPLLLEQLQDRAASLGADALIRVRTGWRLSDASGFRPDLQQDYGLAPLANPNPAQTPGSKETPWAIGIAIRFEKGAEKP